LLDGDGRSDIGEKKATAPHKRAAALNTLAAAASLDCVISDAGARSGLCWQHHW
jgi:hypothetical protein